MEWLKSSEERSAVWILSGGLILLAILLLFISILWSQTYEAVYRDYATSKALADAQGEFDKECRKFTNVDDALDCAGRAIRFAREAQRAEEDLYAQKQMAQWAWWLLISTSLLGIISTAITGVGTYFLVRTVQIGGEANSVARETFVAQTRPWVKVESVLLEEMRREGDTLLATIQVNSRNVGNSPVKVAQVCPIFEFGLLRPVDFPIYKRKDQFAGSPIFVGDEFQYRITMNVRLGSVIERRDSNRRFLHKGGTEEHFLAGKRKDETEGFGADINVLVAIFYQFDGSERVHCTLQGYSIVRDCPPNVTINGIRGGGGIKYSSIDLVQGEINPPGLGLERLEYYTHAD